MDRERRRTELAAPFTRENLPSQRSKACWRRRITRPRDNYLRLLPLDFRLVPSPIDLAKVRRCSA